MSPWASFGRRVFKGRVYDVHGVPHTRTFATDDPDTAVEIRLFLKRLRTQRRFETLQLIIDREFDAFTLYQADAAGVLANVIADRRKALAQQEARTREANLDVMLNEWKSAGAKAVYLRQCREMIPEGERFPASQFTRKVISSFLHSLPVQGPTKNRYRAALGQFAKFLVEREVIQGNPVRDVQGFKENKPRKVHYDDAVAHAVINALEYPYRALEALMCGTGMEWSAAIRVRKSDIDLNMRSVHAHGTKTEWRDREVRFLDEFSWNAFTGYAVGFVGDLPLFGSVRDKEALAAHHAAVKAVKAPGSVLHDWRHTFAVRERRKGTPLQIIKHQLGHSPNSTLVERRYGAYTPTAEDYNRLSAATPIATPRRKRIK